MIKIPDVTLVACDSMCHQLTKLALEQSTRNIEFGDVIFFTDKKEYVPDCARWIPTYIDSNFEYEMYTWYGVPFHIKTSHFLIIQWDGFVINSQAWEDEFLNYDYIGAPWSYDYIVGNGGFSLRSVKMTKHIANMPNIYKFKVPEDQAICRHYSDLLSRYGFKFADKKTASRFSFEAVINLNNKASFGFHAVWNFPRIMDEKTLEERIALFPDYILKTHNVEGIEVTKAEMSEKGLKCGYMSLE